MDYLHFQKDNFHTSQVIDTKEPIFPRHCYLIHSYDDYFHSNSRSKIHAYVKHTHPSKMKILACNEIYGCHLYTLNLLLVQSRIPLLLHKYGFISCYFNFLHLHKILMLDVFKNVCVNFNVNYCWKSFINSS